MQTKKNTKKREIISLFSTEMENESIEDFLQ